MGPGSRTLGGSESTKVGCGSVNFLGRNVNVLGQIHHMMTTTDSVKLRCKDGADTVDLQCDNIVDDFITAFDHKLT